MPTQLQLRHEFSSYRCWVFDCDGVLLNSNAAKTHAFHDVALPFGEDVADTLVSFHIEHGGISRFVKFQHFFSDILKREPEDGEMEHMLDQFSQAAKAQLLSCAKAPHIDYVLQAVAKTGPVYVVSGGMQDELRDVFAQRGLNHHFSAIFGSPDTKDTILERERKNGAMPDPALFIGDAQYDFEVAERFGLDFLFVSDWSEFSDWQNYFQNKSIMTASAISDLLTS